jgi:hypothetical protein
MSEPEHDAARRFAALEALNLLPPDRRLPEVLAGLEAALDAREPQLLCSALFALQHSGPSFSSAGKPATLEGRVAALTAHDDPAVRGRAFGLLSALAWLSEPAAKRRSLETALRDAHPFVRAVAAEALGQAGSFEAVPALLLVTEDTAAARYELGGFTTLEGSPGSLVTNDS